MAVKIRLARRGRKKLALYDIVISDARSPRDGRFIEKIGSYNPNTNPATIFLRDDRAMHWLMVGAQPTETAGSILRYKGILMRKHLQVGINKGAMSVETAELRFQEFMEQRENKIIGKIDNLADAKTKARATRQEAESKVRVARQDVIDQRVAALAAAEDAARVEAEANAKVAAESIQAASVEAMATTENTEAVTDSAPQNVNAFAKATQEEAPVLESVTEQIPTLETPAAQAVVADEVPTVEAPNVETPSVEAVVETPVAEVAEAVTEAPVAEVAEVVAEAPVAEVGEVVAEAPVAEVAEAEVAPVETANEETPVSVETAQEVTPEAPAGEQIAEAPEDKPADPAA
jgi:small subunit ribosomal protein S16